jgi:menaquinone-specific isochorismate synthase
MFNELCLDSAAIISMQNGLIYIGYGAYQKFHSYDLLDSHKPAFFLPDFFLSSNHPWIQYENGCEISITDLLGLLEDIPDSGGIDWKIEHKDLFQKAFNDLKIDFKDRRLEKAVPYVFAYASEKMTHLLLVRSLKKALSIIKEYPGYLYGHWDGDHGFLGVSPEILFQYSQNRPNTLVTMALAGTQKDKENQIEFMEDEKKLKEHCVVIEGIVQSLQDLGSITIGNTEVLKLPTLNHLLTRIEVDLDYPLDFMSAVRSLHPTPALGAFPRPSGKLWLENYQKKLDRGNYGAPFGFQLGAGKLSCCLVAIRQVQWNALGMRIGAGCGIVEKSQFHQEWNEIQLKIQAIRNTLAL